MTVPSAQGGEMPQYDMFLAGLGREATADECEQWAREHVGDPDVPRALIQAGWQRSQHGASEHALELFRQALKQGGEQARNAQVAIIEQLYVLERTAEGDRARDVLRAELDALSPPDLRIYNDMVELLSEWAEPESAMAWCEAALARAEEAGADREHLRDLLVNRSLVREQLGVEPDEADLVLKIREDAALQKLTGKS
jgi:tetratricopeptide (TPR) repeat protein